MSENDARSFVVMMRRAFMMFVSWADDWLVRHPIKDKAE